MDKYEVVCEIGKGNFGTVSKIIRKSDKKILIWKELKYEGISDKEKQLIINEINLLKEMNHSNIVKHYETINDEINSKLYIVMEYCDGGDLDKLILKNKFYKKFLDEKLIWDILIQILIALNYIHNEKKILHRDIKPSNIFLDKDWNIKLGDFGLSKKFYHEFTNTIIGTPLYMSPELLERKPYNVKSDIWALGCSIYELTTFSTPYEAPNMDILLNKIRNGLPQRINKTYSDRLWNMISKMLAYDYNKRPSSLELIVEYNKFFSFNKSINNNRNDIIKMYKQLYLLYKQKYEKIENEQKEKEKKMKKREDLLNKKAEEQNIKEVQLNKKEKELEKKEKEQNIKEMELEKKKREINNILKEINNPRNIIENHRNMNYNQNCYFNNGDNKNNNLLNQMNINNDDKNNNYEYNNNNLNKNKSNNIKINKNDININNREIKDEFMDIMKKKNEDLNINKRNNHNKNQNNLNCDYNNLDSIDDNINVLVGNDQKNVYNDNNNKYLNNNQINSKNNINANINQKEVIKNNYHYYSKNNQNEDDMKLYFNYNNNDENILEPVNNDMNQENNQNLINQNYQKETNENQNKFNNHPNSANNERENLNENEDNERRMNLQKIDQVFDSKKNTNENKLFINNNNNNKNDVNYNGNNNKNISNNNSNNNNYNINNINNNNNIIKNNNNNNNYNINIKNNYINNDNYKNNNYQQNKFPEVYEIQYLYYKNKKIFPKIGLINKDDSSYLNVILIILGNIEELAFYFLNPNKISFFGNTKNIMPISYEMTKFFQNYYPKHNNKIKISNYYDPSSLLFKIKGRRKNELKNPNNFLQDLFSILNYELMPEYKDKEISLIKKQDMKNSINDSIILFKEKNKSPIFDIFSFYKINESKCKHCNSSYFYLKYSFTFKLNISGCYSSLENKEHKMTIQDCLNYQSQNPKINKKYPCNKCKQNKEISSKIYSSPKIFLFLLDRGNNFDKNKNELLKIPFLIEKNIDLQKFIRAKNSPTKYELVGIVSITLSDEKYVANIKSPIDNNWYYFNDLKVQEIIYDNVINSNNNNNYYVPCILVYKSINDK